MILDFHTHRPLPDGVFTPRCFGIHPWHASDTTVCHWPKPDSYDMIGECGLDKCCSTDWTLQKEVFAAHLKQAEQQHKPVVIHCVRAFGELMEMRKSYRSTPWVVHGFTGTAELARQLHGQCIGVSFGAAILDGRHAKARKALQAMGAENLFLETDDSDSSIFDIYREAALLLGIDINLLADTINRHYSALLET